MEVIYILVPISVVILVIAIAIFLWAVNSGQFDDLDTPAWNILHDDLPGVRHADSRDNGDHDA